MALRCNRARTVLESLISPPAFLRLLAARCNLMGVARTGQDHFTTHHLYGSYDLEVPHLGCKKSPPTATNAAFSGAMRNSRTFPQCVRKLVPRDSMVFRDSPAETFYVDKLAGFTDFSETTKRTSLKFCYTFEAGFPSFGKKWALMRFLLGRRAGEIPIASCFEPERSEDC